MFGDLTQYLSSFGANSLMILAIAASILLFLDSLVAFHKKDSIVGAMLMFGSFGAIFATIGYAFGTKAGYAPIGAAALCAGLSLVAAGWRAHRPDVLTKKLVGIALCVLLFTVFGALANGLAGYISFDIGIIAAGFELRWWLAVILALFAVAALMMTHLVVTSTWVYRLDSYLSRKYNALHKMVRTFPNEIEERAQTQPMTQTRNPEPDRLDTELVDEDTQAPLPQRAVLFDEHPSNRS